MSASRDLFRPRRTLEALLTVIVVASFASGCDEYRISLRADGDRLERTISWWSDGEAAPFDGETAAEIAATYGLEPPSEPQHSLTTRFAGPTPDDIGGAGSFTRRRTSLGTLAHYMERFRGTDELVELRKQSHDRIALFFDLLDGWLGEQMAGTPESEPLRRFVRERVAHDCENVDLYALAGQMSSDPLELALRMLQYGAERGYLDVDELPRLIRLFNAADDEGASALARVAATQIGIPPDEPLPESMRFLVDAEGVERSFTAYVGKDPRFERWRAGRPGDATPDEWLEDHATPFGEGLDGFLLGGFFATGLVVTLEPDAEPISTNGEWNRETGRVEWRRFGLPDEDEVTRLLYATWTLPDRETQETRFGEVALEGRPLARYLMLRLALTEEDAAEWEAFLATLTPGPQLVEEIQRFRFADERTPEKREGVSRASDMIRAIVEPLSA